MATPPQRPDGSRPGAARSDAEQEVQRVGGKNFEFRSEFYNIFNHANFANPGNLRLAAGLPTGPGAAGMQPGVAFRMHGGRRLRQADIHGFQPDRHRHQPPDPTVAAI